MGRKKGVSDHAERIVDVGGTSDDAADDIENILGAEPTADLPIGDAFQLDPLKLERMKDKGIDTRLARCRVFRLHNGRRIRQSTRDGCSEWTPNTVTVKWVRDNWGAGDYDLSVLNELGQYLGTTRVSVDADELAGNGAAVDAGHGPRNGAAVGNALGGLLGGGSSLIEGLLVRALQRGLDPPPAPPAPAQDSSWREMLAASVRINQETNQLVNRILLARAAEPASAATPPAPDPLAMLEKLSAVWDRLAPKPNPAQSGGLEQFLPTFKFAMALAQMTQGNGAPKQGEPMPEWMTLIPEIADKLGVPLIVTIAQAALPKERAEQVIHAIEEQMKARQAEAEAQTLDTEGEPVGP